MNCPNICAKIRTKSLTNVRIFAQVGMGRGQVHTINRRYLIALAGLGIALLGLLAMLAVDRTVREATLSDAKEEAQYNAALLTAGFKSELDKFTLVPRVLAIDPEVEALLANGGNPASLNARLADLAKQTGAAALYVMDAKGTAIAASNAALPTSFVGSNYRFRRYFSDALRDGETSEFALGTVSRRPGLYIARRVEAGGAPLGVVAIKVEFDAIEQSWRAAEAGVFVTDADGVVLITSNPNWRFRTTKPKAKDAVTRARDQLRFGTSALQPLDVTAYGAQGTSSQLLDNIQPVANAGGWELHLLIDAAPRLSTAIANGRLWVMLALVSSVLLGGAFILWRKRREAEAEAMIAARTATLRDQLIQANRLATLGQVTAGVGHEIRQPVAAMRIFAESGAKLLTAGHNTAAAENFDKIIHLTDRIGQITEELHRFSRRGARAPRDLPLSHAIDGALLLLKERINRAGITLHLPDPADAQMMVRAGHVRLEQVLVNLIQNALDAATPEGWIAIEIATEGNHCLLTVADNGHGIDAATMATLFQPFATTKEEGLGLGLVISQDIMRGLGGDLRVESGPDGTRFIMVIPRA